MDGQIGIVINQTIFFAILIFIDDEYETEVIFVTTLFSLVTIPVVSIVMSML
ncbi:MAG TPA: hypothetical protein VF941_09225 [Clostridia bacterium]